VSSDPDAGRPGPVLEVEALSIAYAVRGGHVRAVRGASLAVAAGETVALVGESGSGKSSLAFAVMGALEANGRVVGGAVRFRGRSLLDLGAAELRRLRGARLAMVFQDPQTALNPSMPVGAQVVEVLRVHEGLRREAARARTLALFAQVNLPAPAVVFDRYPHELSGGQQQRIVIAMAFACNPELLILDEPTTGLDVTTEARILDLLEELTGRHRSAVLYITHNLGVVARFCRRVVVMYAGEVVETGPVARVFAAPRHPYTRGLLASGPRLAVARRDVPLTVIEGGLPSLVHPPAGCVFEPRCPERVAACAERKPAAEPTPDGGLVRCLRFRELAPFDRAGPAPARPAAAAPAVAAAPGPASRLEVEGLRCHYPARQGWLETLRREPPRAVRAVDDVSLAVAAGRTLSIVGESGCGKTTLARAVVGLLAPTAGAIRLDARDIGALAARRPREVRRRVQIVFQNPDATLNPQKTVEETLRRPLDLFGLAPGHHDVLHDHLRDPQPRLLLRGAHRQPELPPHVPAEPLGPRPGGRGGLPRGHVPDRPRLGAPRHRGHGGAPLAHRPRRGAGALGRRQSVGSVAASPARREYATTPPLRARGAFPGASRRKTPPVDRSARGLRVAPPGERLGEDRDEDEGAAGERRGARHLADTDPHPERRQDQLRRREELELGGRQVA
jgi:peptide/nickel transport system ATP-binding protein